MDAPRDGERIIVLQRRCLRMYLNGKRLMEIRDVPLRRSTYLLGCDGLVYARVRVTEHIQIKTRTSWRRLHVFHRMITFAPLYGEHTWGTMFQIVEVADTPFPYVHLRGATCIVVYRRP